MQSRGRQSSRKKREKSIFDPTNENARQRRRKHDNVSELMRSTVLKECFDVCAYLMDWQEAEPFNDPVDWKSMGLWDYPHIVKNPMDLGTVKELLLDSTLDSHETFADYMRLVFRNSMTYNLEGAPIWYTAQYLLQEFEGMYDEVLQRNRLGPYANMALAAKALAAVFPESEDDDDEIKALREQIQTLQKEFTNMQEEKKLLEFGPTTPPPQSPAPQTPKENKYEVVKMTKPRRPLSYAEKEALCAEIPNLDQSFLPGLLEIFQAAQSNQNADEVEIDIEKLDDKTLIKVASYVQRSLIAQEKMQAELAMGGLPVDQDPPKEEVVQQEEAPLAPVEQAPEPMDQDIPHSEVAVKSENPDAMQVV